MWKKQKTRSIMIKLPREHLEREASVSFKHREQKFLLGKFMSLIQILIFLRLLYINPLNGPNELLFTGNFTVNTNKHNKEVWWARISDDDAQTQVAPVTFRHVTWVSAIMFINSTFLHECVKHSKMYTEQTEKITQMETDVNNSRIICCQETDWDTNSFRIWEAHYYSLIEDETDC